MGIFVNWGWFIYGKEKTGKVFANFFLNLTKFSIFFLTPLLTNLALSEGSCNLKDSVKQQNDHSDDTNQIYDVNANTNSSSKGFLIVETNFRVFAYTNSDLQIAILSTFTELNCRFENLSIGLITRDSVRRALQV